MDKFRRNRKTTPTRNQPATSSASSGTPASSTTTSATKYTIQQKVPTGSGKKVPYSVKRTVDPNEVVIKRRIGEGSKPLFARDGLNVNRSVSPKRKRSALSRSSSDSSSPSVRNRTKERSKSETKKRKSVEKIPYFLDENREKERVRRVYGGSRRSRSLSRGRRGRSRSRSPYYRRHRNYDGRRTPSRERYRSRHRTEYSRSRSRSRERRRNSYRHRNGSVDGRPPPLQTQFIPIPVPVEYPYLPPAWGPPMMPPQARFPFIMRPPMPRGIPFVPRHLRPPRFNVNPNFHRGYNMPDGFQKFNYPPRR